MQHNRALFQVGKCIVQYHLHKSYARIYMPYQFHDFHIDECHQDLYATALNVEFKKIRFDRQRQKILQGDTKKINHYQTQFRELVQDSLPFKTLDRLPDSQIIMHLSYRFYMNSEYAEWIDSSAFQYFQYQNHTILINSAARRAVELVFDAFPETVAIDGNSLFFLLNHSLWANHGMALHGTAFRHNDCAWLFLGASGSGKSTLKRSYPDLECYSDDGVVLHYEPNGEFTVYPSPFYQFSRSRHQLDIHPSSLKAIFFLFHGDRTHQIPAMDKFSNINRIMIQQQHFYDYLSPVQKRFQFEQISHVLDKIACHNLFISLTEKKLIEILNITNTE